MPKCQICNVNEAVIILTKIENEKRISEGVCLKCALEKNLAGLEDLFAQSGVTKENVDEIQERINLMLREMGNDGQRHFMQALMSSDFDINQVLEQTNELLETESDNDDDQERSLGDLMPASKGKDIAQDKSNQRNKQRTRRNDRKKKYLDQFGMNLNERAKEGKIDQIIGRDKEIDRVVQILNRRTKNNPVLLGEPGVGKTAIAQGLALRIVEGKVPAKLLDREVYQIDMTSMVAGTQFRGQFEARMKGVVNDAMQSGNVILVIDELHNIMGAGDAEGAMNAANILKPALAAGEICVLGSTTLDEYRRHIEKDSALERRFQKVVVDEPNVEDCLEILKGISHYYEKHHHVTYSDETLAEAVRLSKRYIQDRFLPDKAIDLLDEAGSRVNLDNSLLTKIKESEDELTALRERMEELEDPGESGVNEEEALMKLYQEKAELKQQLLTKEGELQELQEESKPVPITKEDIADVVEMWTGIPVKSITESEGEKLLKLEDRLHERVIGQNEAVDALARSVRRKRAGFGKKDKPASFLFVGPTGVGKTELAKSLAEVLFESEESLIRLDMSEFMEAHTVAKLIGSPPGYVGYDDGGQLTEKIRRNPYSVILLDEIEKAHKDVYNILLQILDDGRLTDSHGRVVSFANTILIMTSNAGTTLKAHGIGFGQDGHISMENRVKTVLREIFRPEFLNRIDEIIVFTELSKKELRSIVDLMLEEVIANMKASGYKLSVSPAAKDALTEKGYSPQYGARPLRKAIQREVEEKLSDLLLAGDLDGKKAVKLGFSEGEFTFKLVE